MAAANAHRTAADSARGAGDKKTARTHDSEVDRHFHNAKLLHYNTKGFLGRLKEDLFNNSEVTNAWSPQAREAAELARKEHTPDRHHTVSELLDVGHHSTQQFFHPDQAKEHLEQHGIQSKKPLLSRDHVKVKDAQQTIEKLKGAGYKHIGFHTDSGHAEYDDVRHEMLRGHEHDITVTHSGSGHGMVGVRGQVRVTKQGTPHVILEEHKIGYVARNQQMDEFDTAMTLVNNTWSDAARQAALQARKAGSNVDKAVGESVKASNAASSASREALSSSEKTGHFKPGSRRGEESQHAAQVSHANAEGLHYIAAAQAVTSGNSVLGKAHYEAAAAHKNAIIAHGKDMLQKGTWWTRFKRFITRNSANLPDATTSHACSCGGMIGSNGKCMSCSKQSTGLPEFTQRFDTTSNEFSTDAQRRAFFGHMAKKTEGSSQTAYKKSGWATRKGTAEGHAGAAKAHREAARDHKAKGHREQAKNHWAMAKHHDEEWRKAMNFKGKSTENMDRAELLTVLTTTCSCQTDRAALNALTDDELRTRAAAVQVAATQANNADDEDEEADSSIGSSLAVDSEVDSDVDSEVDEDSDLDNSDLDSEVVNEVTDNALRGWSEAARKAAALARKYGHKHTGPVGSHLTDESDDFGRNPFRGHHMFNHKSPDGGFVTIHPQTGAWTHSYDTSGPSEFHSGRKPEKLEKSLHNWHGDPTENEEQDMPRHQLNNSLGGLVGPEEESKRTAQMCKEYGYEKVTDPDLRSFANLVDGGDLYEHDIGHQISLTQGGDWLHEDDEGKEEKGRGSGSLGNYLKTKHGAPTGNRAGDATQGDDTMKWADLIKQAPPETQAAIRNAEVQYNTQRTQLATILVNANPGLQKEQREKLFAKLSVLSLEDLQERAMLLPPPVRNSNFAPVQLEDAPPLFLGAGGGPNGPTTANRGTGIDPEKDLLEQHVMNFDDEAVAIRQKLEQAGR